jgi:hypothetical protein
LAAARRAVELGSVNVALEGREPYLQGISPKEIVSTVHARREPMMHASAGLDL